MQIRSSFFAVLATVAVSLLAGCGSARVSASAPQVAAPTPTLALAMPSEPDPLFTPPSDFEMSFAPRGGEAASSRPRAAKIDAALKPNHVQRSRGQIRPARAGE